MSTVYVPIPALTLCLEYPEDGGVLLTGAAGVGVVEGLGVVDGLGVAEGVDVGVGLGEGLGDGERLGSIDGEAIGEG